MLGFYENFPANIHRADLFTSSLSKNKLQQRLTRVLHEANCRTFSFEEVGNPTVPNSSVIFEFGIADTGGFNFIDEAEAKKMLSAIAHEPLRLMDLFCGIRYYKKTAEKKSPLKFDYYMMRIGFGENSAVELQVCHERGPRYLSPEDLVNFVVGKVNGASARKILKPNEPA
jgi:hypothetical protein